ncbi:MAG: GSCFA domain-containing protein [Methylobacteriaceae bacterium]|nr:GSCFA domain-containing protein [Methylobacteriaceae bacterium]
MSRPLRTDPYRAAPARAFWSRAVARGFEADAVYAGPRPLIPPGATVASAGSCFAVNVVPYLEAAGFPYLRTEAPHPLFADLEPEPFSYARFSAAYGNIYTARQLLQLLRRATGSFHPVEDRWETPDGIVDPFRPGLRRRARSEREFDLLTAQHLGRCREVFAGADIFIFTLGLTEAWTSHEDGAVFPACPGTVAGTFDPDRHIFHNFTVSEVAADLSAFVTELRALNPRVRVVLTVSPVPLVATATGGHVLAATTYSKSVLRAAAGEVAAALPEIVYFPAYEIVTGPQAPAEFFEPDRRNVSEAGIRAVMAPLLRCCGVEPPGELALAATSAPQPHAMAALSNAVAEADCEEAMADQAGPPPASGLRRLVEGAVELAAAFRPRTGRTP